MVLQLHLLHLASQFHDHGSSKAISGASAPAAIALGPKAALALERMVADRVRGMTDLDLGSARLSDTQAGALAALLPCFNSGLERLRVSGSLMSDTAGATLLSALEACPWQPCRLDLSGNASCGPLLATALARCLQCASTYRAQLSSLMTMSRSGGTARPIHSTCVRFACLRLSFCECCPVMGRAALHEHGTFTPCNLVCTGSLYDMPDVLCMYDWFLFQRSLSTLASSSGLPCHVTISLLLDSLLQ